MKRKCLLVLLALVCALTLALGLTACGDNSGGTNSGNSTDGTQHEHTFEEGYSGYNDTFHWHKATCEHKSETDGKEKHVFTDGALKCDKCEYTKQEKEPAPEKTYKTVSFDLNGGKGDINSKQFAVGEIMADLPIPSRDGYKFICWTDAIGEEYTAASTMPNENLSLKAKWEKVLANYEDKYVSFKPANTGWKSDNIKLDYDEADKYVYVEITSDDLGGVNKVGETNNFSLRNIEGMEYKVNSGYTMLWYRSDFETVNAAQRFTLDYGSNVQFVTVSDENGNVLQTYLVDIYVKHDYYISLYKNVYETSPYDKIRIIENERFAADTATEQVGNFEFDKRVYFNENTATYEPFVYSTAITKNWELYQIYKPVTVETELNGGTLEGKLTITPYTAYFILPSPEKAGYDFLGWQTEDGKYLTNVQGYSGDKYISAENTVEKLIAIYAEKQMYYSFDNETLKTYKTVPVVTYTDKSMTEILEVVYTPYNEDCILPVKTVQGNGQIFRGWQYYAVNSEGKFNISPVDFFGVERKTTAPVALIPEFDTSANTVIPLNEEKTFSDISSYSMYLPASKAYTLKITASGSVTFTLSTLAGNSESKQTYTVNSEQPLTVKVSNYRYELGSQKVCGGGATLTVTSLSGSFTALFSGDTADTEGTTATFNNGGLAKAGENVTLELDNPGYVFDGLYYNRRKVSEGASFVMPEEEVTYNAFWDRIKIYQVLNWNEEGTEAAGIVKPLTGTYVYGGKVTLSATVNPGYTFAGWFYGPDYDGAKISGELEFEHELNTILEFCAVWYKVENTVNYPNAGYVRQGVNSKNKYFAGQEVTVEAYDYQYLGYIYKGWYWNDTLVSKELTYAFTMPDGDLIDFYEVYDYNLTAVWEIAEGLEDFNFTSTKTSLTITGVKDSTVKQLIVPEIANQINQGALKDCTEIETLEIPFFNRYGYLGHYFGANDSSKNEQYVPKSLKNVIITSGDNIGRDAFYGCSGLTSVTIPDSVTSIYDSAFSNCTGLASVYYTGDIESWCTIWFQNMWANPSYYANCLYIDNELVTELIIPDGMTKIGDCAFSGYNGLISVTIPASVTEIGNSAFLDCYRLVEINNLSTLEIKKHSSDNGYIGSYALNIYTPENGSSKLSIIDDEFIFYSDDDIAYLVGYIGKQTDLKLPDSFNGEKYAIYEYAFYNWSGLTNIIIPDSVTEIGDYAFSSCGLASVIIPDSVTYIGREAFSYCGKLEVIYCEADSGNGWSRYWNAYNYNNGSPYYYYTVIWNYNNLTE